GVTDGGQLLPGMGLDIIHGLAPADILYRGVQTGAVFITLGDGPTNTFTVENTNTAADGNPTTITTGRGLNAVNTVNVLRTTGPLNLVGGGGTNTLVGPNAPTGFNITGSNAGNLSGGVSASFSNFQNLTGSSGNDAFIFADGAGVDGNIAGSGGGTNTLDYRAYSTSVIVDLQTGFASGVGGS